MCHVGTPFQRFAFPLRPHTRALYGSLSISEMTESEIDTIRFFEKIGIEIIRIHDGVEKAPDFYLEIDNQGIYVEVKEISDNADEIALIKEVEAHGFSSVHDSPEIGRRFRPAIQSANRQLKQRCSSGEPGLVIIQDVRNFFTRSMFPVEEVKLAMFGDRVTWISTRDSRLTADLYEKNKTVTENKNTTVSAVGLMVKNINDQSLTLHIFHNPHAKNMMKVGTLLSDSVIEYKIRDTRSYGSFERV